MILSPWFQRVLSLNMDGVADYVKEGLDLYMTGSLKTQDSSLCFQLALLPSEPYFLLSGQHKDRSILWNPRHYFFMFIYMWEFLRNHTSNQMKILLSCTPCWEVSKHTLHNKAVKSVDKYLPTLPNYLYADLTLTFLYLLQPKLNIFFSQNIFFSLLIEVKIYEVNILVFKPTVF